MGMYTELVISARIRNTPEVVAVLSYMAGLTEEKPTLPDHPLFSTTRWRWLFSCSSYYFVPRAMVKFEYDDVGEYWCLISRADLKNYDDEIEKFIDWIRPYIEDEDTMFAYSRYEQTREPTIYYSSER